SIRTQTHHPGPPGWWVSGVPGLVALPIECGQQSVEECHLTLDQFAAGCVDVEPLCPVDLRERLQPAGSRRPLNLEGVAPAARRIEVGRPGEGDHRLAALRDRPQLQ